MTWLTATLVVALTLVGASIEALAGPWPKLREGSPSQCVPVLRLAREAFKSGDALLYAPPRLPENFDSKLALSPEGLDISGGDALVFDAEVFDKLPKGGNPAARSIYWQKRPAQGFRFAIVETPVGWRGDMYALFAVAENIEPVEFRDVHIGSWNRKSLPLIAEGWRPPLIFRSAPDDALWAVDVGAPYQFLADWQVYALGRQGAERRCVVQFRPDVNKAVNLLPPEVRSLAVLLDQTMGSGENEGTLQPTARLSLNATHAWANAALRPWAMGAAYNSRAEVDAGLLAWSKTGASYARAYQRILDQLVLAEAALAGHYRKNFPLSAEQAHAQAAYVLDVALRSHYAFHSNEPFDSTGGRKAGTNPWSPATR